MRRCAWTLIALVLLAGCSLSELTAGEEGSDAGAVTDAALGGAPGKDVDADSALEADVGLQACEGRGEGYCNGVSGIDFCEDFDNEKDLEQDFELQTSGPGEVVKEASSGCGPSKGVRLELSGVPDCNYANLVRRHDGNYQKAILSADVLLGDEGTGNGFQENRIFSVSSKSQDGSKDCMQFIYVQPTRARLHSQGAGNQFNDMRPISGNVTPGRWTRVEMTLEHDADGFALIGIRFDGAEVFPPTKVDKCGAGRDLIARIGLFCEDTPLRMWVDNVSLDVE